MRDCTEPPRSGRSSGPLLGPEAIRTDLALATKKIRVYELARELGVDNQVVLDLAEELKIGVKSHSSSIDDPSADRVRRLADSRELRGEPIVDEPKQKPAETTGARGPGQAQAARARTGPGRGD